MWQKIAFCKEKSESEAPECPPPNGKVLSSVSLGWSDTVMCGVFGTLPVSPGFWAKRRLKLFAQTTGGRVPEGPPQGSACVVPSRLGTLRCQSGRDPVQLGLTWGFPPS